MLVYVPFMQRTAAVCLRFDSNRNFQLNKNSYLPKVIINMNLMPMDFYGHCIF